MSVDLISPRIGIKRLKKYKQIKITLSTNVDINTFAQKRLLINEAFSSVRNAMSNRSVDIDTEKKIRPEPYIQIAKSLGLYNRERIGSVIPNSSSVTRGPNPDFAKSFNIF